MKKMFAKRNAAKRMTAKKTMITALAVTLTLPALTGCGEAGQTGGTKKTRVVLNEVAHSVN